MVFGGSNEQWVDIPIEDIGREFSEAFKPWSPGVRGAKAQGKSPATHLRHPSATRRTKLDVVRQDLGHVSLTTSIYVKLARGVMDQELQEYAI